MNYLPKKWLTSFLKAFFDLLYHQFAWAYDIVSRVVSLGMWNKWIRSIVPELKGPRILELGHGSGHLQIALLKEGREVTGLDISRQMVRICAKRIRKTGLSPQLVNCRAQNLPFPDNAFHQVAATFPTEYIIAKETIRESHRVLIPGGKLIIIPIAWITGKNIFHKTASWLFKVTGQAGDSDENTYARLVALLEEEGFNPELEFMELTNSRLLIFRGIKEAK
jgi:ubiquinone/menaquinone biosynthesis C-methylase UbiE